MKNNSKKCLCVSSFCETAALACRKLVQLPQCVWILGGEVLQSKLTICTTKSNGCVLVCALIIFPFFVRVFRAVVVPGLIE